MPPAARSVFFNITNLHDRRHMVNAVLEGICYQMRWIIEIYHKKIGKTIHSIRVVGGCASSDHWMQMMANILQFRLKYLKIQRMPVQLERLIVLLLVWACVMILKK